MSTLIDPGLMGDVLKFGAADVTACYSCGNCTATCPLADNDASFPRGIIRLAQVGLTDDLVSSKELWTCYQCGECTTKCPTQADPAEFMATSRRYAIAHYDKSGLARVFATKPAVGWLLVVVFAAIFAGFFMTVRGPADANALVLFDFIPYPVIHWTGIGVMVLVAVFAVWGVASLARDMARKDQVTWKELTGSAEGRRRASKALWYSLGIESLGQRRYREDCVDSAPIEPLYRRRWLIHALTLWGFLGLMLATGLDYGLDVAGIKATGTPVPLWYPTRALGTVAGLALLYGVTWFIIKRIQRAGVASRTSTPMDWMFLGLLWVTGLTGFLIEVALYVTPAPTWGYWVFLVHVAIALELVLFLPFTKFAHAMYRPVGLFFYSLAKQRTDAG